MIELDAYQLKLLFFLLAQGSKRSYNFGARTALQTWLGKSGTFGKCDALLEELARLGLVTLSKQKETDPRPRRATLTPMVEAVLAREVLPLKNNHQQLGLGHLRRWLELMRVGAAGTPPDRIPDPPPEPPVSAPVPPQPAVPAPPSSAKLPPPTPDEMLAAILHIDRELGLRNWVPIFHLRERFRERLAREELDQLLFQLVADRRVRLGTLQEAHLYTADQVATGIPSAIGGPRFFLYVRDPDAEWRKIGGKQG